jgi:hypothetical protein
LFGKLAIAFSNGFISAPILTSRNAATVLMFFPLKLYL